MTRLDTSVKRFVHPIGAVLVTGTVLAAPLVACTDNTGNVSENNVLEAQQQALDRARGVEKDVADAARRRAEEIGDSGGDD